MGDLIKKYKNENQTFSDEQIKNWSKQILNGLSYLHANNVVHRDIKPRYIAKIFYHVNLVFKSSRSKIFKSNIFLSEANESKAVIGDFGLARTLNELKLKPLTAISGTSYYLCPEVFEFQTTCASDIWYIFSCLFSS